MGIGPSEIDEQDLFTSALVQAAQMFQRAAEEETRKRILPSEWIERFYWIPRPRDPITGAVLPPGPIVLTEFQRRLLNEALKVDETGKFKYVTVIWSAPKKSGKSAIAAAVANYLAETTDFARVYCLANDGKQSSDRLYGPIRTNYILHRTHGGPLADVRPSLTELIIPRNQSKIEAIPCDATGEAGAEPTGVFISEAWGWIEESKRRLFVEMTVPPTLYGFAIRWVESYAGYIGVSDLLYDLYQLGVVQGVPHPDFSDLVGRDGEPVVYVNESARLFCYWDTKPRMIWQDDTYYEQEAKILPDMEFRRVHQNQWVSPVGSFIQPEWWDKCADPAAGLPEGSPTPVVVAVDAATSGDCAAIVAVCRNAVYPETDVDVVAAKIFKPKRGVINLEETVGKTIREWNQKWNVQCIAYDAYQMEKLAQDYRQGKVFVPAHETEGMSADEREEYIRRQQQAVRNWYLVFNQHGQRAVADKRLYDMILNGQIHWNPNDLNSDIAERGMEETLTKHIKQAGAETKKGSQMRIEKLSRDAHVDGAVALSMAVDLCMRLNLTNRQSDPRSLVDLYQRGQISYDALMEQLRARRVRLGYE